MDREGTYYAVKLNPCIAVTTFGCKANYLAWIQRYDYAGFTPVSTLYFFITLVLLTD